MATHIVLSSPGETVTIDQSIIENDELIVEVLADGATLNITNTHGLWNSVAIDQAMGGASSLTVSLGNDAHAVLRSLTTQGDGSHPLVNYALGKNATLEMAADFVPPATYWIPRVDMSASEGSATLVYNGPWYLQLGRPVSVFGISNGDQIQVPGATHLYNFSPSQLSFQNSSGDILLEVAAIGGLDPSLITFNNGTMRYACYLKGTSIATPEGEVKVEDLQIGDTVTTGRGGVATVKWVGWRTLRKARIPAAQAKLAFPITFLKDCVADNVPHRDVSVSPHHLVLIDGSLIPAKALINGMTITQDLLRRDFTYYHVELDSFDILLADGLPAESYVDMGNRSMFENADTVALHPDFEAPTDGGRPPLEGITVQRSGAAVEAVRRRLRKRAQAWAQQVRLSA
jgi:hypothetical protein